MTQKTEKLLEKHAIILLIDSSFFHGKFQSFLSGIKKGMTLPNYKVNFWFRKLFSCSIEMKVIHFYIQVFFVVVDYQGTCGVVKKLFFYGIKNRKGGGLFLESK